MALSALFTDLYELTMAKALYAAGKTQELATFELFFRRCPMGGEYVVAAGHDHVRTILEEFRFTQEEVNFLRAHHLFKNAPEDFFDYLKDLDLSGVIIRGPREGSLVFPLEPLLQVTGPVIKTQLLETALLNAVNFASLVATTARRMWMSARGAELMEFGLRRAQGPDGGMTATRSSFIGGFNSTSNTLAGMKHGIPVSGTMAHSFVQSFSDEHPEFYQWEQINIEPLLAQAKAEDKKDTNPGELAAFLSYARSFPDTAVFLVDTYDTIGSGVPNAIRVMKILKHLKHRIGGVRLDSGDIAYLSRETRRMLDAAGLAEAKIVASNELDEDIISSLIEQGARVDSYGVGTKLVTAYKEPALGGVYKLVELEGRPRIKISQQLEKRTVPSKKSVYRLYGSDGLMLFDLMTLHSEAAPVPGKEILAHHPKDPFGRALIIPAKVEPLLLTLFEKEKWQINESLATVQERSLKNMQELREDVARLSNPTPYKVGLSEELKQVMEACYEAEAPPKQLR